MYVILYTYACMPYGILYHWVLSLIWCFEITPTQVMLNECENDCDLEGHKHKLESKENLEALFSWPLAV